MPGDADIVRVYLERAWGAGETAALDELVAERVTVWSSVAMYAWP